MDKRTIRRIIISKRNALTQQEIREKSKLIHEKLLSLPDFLGAQTACLYMSFGSEVRTPELIEHCFGVGKKVVIPAMAGSLGELVPAEFEGFDKLKEAAMGIMEPFPVKQVPIEEINLVIAPGVAFDEKLNRIGFGKGYYDKFLAKIPAGVPVIAIAFDLQVLPEIPVEPHDREMLKIITEKRIIG